MISAFWIGAVLAAVSPFSEIQLDSLYVGGVNPLSGEVSLNVRQVDINGDGLSDLLFPDRVLLQAEGVFDEGESIALPDVELSPAVDVFEGTVYLRFSGRLAAFRYEENAWVSVLDVEVQWPDALDRVVEGKEAVGEIDGNVIARPPVFERFLHDVNADGSPELVFPIQDGLHIYGLVDGVYIHYPVLDIFPKTKLIPLDEVVSESNVERRLSYPDQHLVFHCVIEGDLVLLLTKQLVHDSMVQYTEYRYSLSLDAQGYGAALLDEPKQTVPFSEDVQPCRLNPDQQIDFAGGVLDYTSSLALLTPIYSTQVQTTPDIGLQLFRSKSFVPHVMFCDVNQDGYLDLILERTDITHGGLRETLNRFTTQRKFRHFVNVHYQQADGRFSSQVDVSVDEVIRLDQTPIRLSEMFERYQGGRLVNFTGDLNGDGMNDCVIQSTPDALSIYFVNTLGEVSKKPLMVGIESHETFHVVDINGDGVSDIVLQGIAEHEGESTPSTRVLLFQKAGV